MNIHSVYAPFQRWFRPRRISRLQEMLPVLQEPNARILDVGGSPGWWADLAPASRDVTVLNLDDRLRDACVAAGLRFVCGDARALPFADGEFDLVFSNSVIEHVGSLSDQQRFASEVMRCGQAVYCQTPNRWFPVEPHLIGLFIHWLPIEFQPSMVRWFTVWGWVTRPSPEKVRAFLASTRLLTRAEIEQLFPGAKRADEVIFGMTKSFVVCIGGRRA
jgi:ubiquinone/menaquinone biosynthesis C-methylase UbiE